MNNEKIIASKGLTNTSAIVVWNIDDYDDTITVSINYGKKSTLKLYETNKGVYFNYGGRQYLNEFIRV